MDFITRFDKAKKLWALTTPGVDLPPDATLVGWLGLVTDREFEIAVLRIPHRIRNWEKKYGSIIPGEVYKFVSTQLSQMRAQRGAR